MLALECLVSFGSCGDDVVERFAIGGSLSELERDLGAFDQMFAELDQDLLRTT